MSQGELLLPLALLGCAYLVLSRRLVSFGDSNRRKQPYGRFEGVSAIAAVVLLGSGAMTAVFSLPMLALPLAYIGIVVFLVHVVGTNVLALRRSK